jgi:hypothetical protein
LPPAPPITLALALTAVKSRVELTWLVAVAIPPFPAVPVSVEPPAPPVALVLPLKVYWATPSV